MSEARQRLADGAAALGLDLGTSQLDAFDAYAALLQAGRQELNLTALSDPVDIAEKHFVDSLSVLRAIPEDGRRVIDVGAGAGFPGLPLKIARPVLHVVLLEATAKKVAWLRRVVKALGLEGVEAVAERAETLAHSPEHRGAYDVAVARAVAPLSVLCELCLPFVRPGGRFIAQKSRSGAQTEVPQAANALRVLGGRMLRSLLVEGVPALPNRALVVVEQVRPVPPQYPRRPGMPSKRPL